MYDVHRRCSGEIIHMACGFPRWRQRYPAQALRRNILSSYDMAIFLAFLPPMD
jgi:hypothetical protein